MTEYRGPQPLGADEYSYVLPLALHYLCPPAVPRVYVCMSRH